MNESVYSENFGYGLTWSFSISGLFIELYMQYIFMWQIQIFLFILDNQM